MHLSYGYQNSIFFIEHTSVACDCMLGDYIVVAFVLDGNPRELVLPIFLGYIDVLSSLINTGFIDILLRFDHGSRSSCFQHSAEFY